jgi:hypothetical protein
MTNNLNNNRVKKYYPVFFYTIVQLFFCAISTNEKIRDNYKYISILTGLFLFLTPTLYYLLTKKREAEFTFWFVFYLTFKITPFIFEMENNFFEIIFKWKIYLNIAFLLYLIWKATVFIINLKKNLFQKRENTIDDFSIISSSLQKSIKFKKIGRLLTFEFCSFYYCFIKWIKSEENENQFSGFKNSGVSSLYIGLMIASIAEAFAFHSILISRNKNLAIAFLILHIYILINLIGHLKAIRYRSHLISAQKILIRYGLFDTLEVPISQILKIEKFEGDYEKNKDLVKFALLGKIEPHNICIELKNILAVKLPFGISREPKKILFYIDDVHNFITIINEKIEKNKSSLTI